MTPGPLEQKSKKKRESVGEIAPAERKGEVNNLPPRVVEREELLKPVGKELENQHVPDSVTEALEEEAGIDGIQGPHEQNMMEMDIGWPSAEFRLVEGTTGGAEVPVGQYFTGTLFNVFDLGVKKNTKIEGPGFEAEAGPVTVEFNQPFMLQGNWQDTEDMQNPIRLAGEEVNPFNCEFGDGTQGNVEVELAKPVAVSVEYVANKGESPTIKPKVKLKTGAGTIEFKAKLEKTEENKPYEVTKVYVNLFSYDLPPISGLQTKGSAFFIEAYGGPKEYSEGSLTAREGTGATKRTAKVGLVANFRF